MTRARHRRARFAARPAAATTPATTKDRLLNTVAGHITTGRENGWVQFIGAWATVDVVQVAQTAAHGSTRFVKFAMTAESIGMGLLLLVAALLQRNLTGRWNRALSTWVAAAGVAAPAVVPNQTTLLYGLIATAWMGQSVSTLRSVVAPRPGELAHRAQERVQAWMYGTMLGAQMVYVAIADGTGSWRAANAVIAALLFADGLYVLLAPDVRRADPRTMPLPGREQSLLDLLGYRPVIGAILAVTLGYVVFGLFFAEVQTELTHLGWGAGVASWIVVATGSSRFLTLELARRSAAAVEAEEHHGRAVILSGAALGASALLAAVTLFRAGLWPATIAIVAAGVMFQIGMNGANPVIRAYVAENSAAASTLVNLGTALGTVIGSGEAVVANWTTAVGTWIGCALLVLVIGWLTLGHRYEAHDWHPRLPAASVLRIRARVVDGWRLEYVLEPRVKLSPALPARTGGPGERVVAWSAFNPDKKRQYWRRNTLFQVAPARGVVALGRWLEENRRARRGTATDRAPGLELLLPLEQCARHDADHGVWLIDSRAVLSRPRVVAQGVGRAPLVADDGRVHGQIPWDAVTHWRIVEVVAVDPRVPWIALPDTSVHRIVTHADGKLLIPATSFVGVGTTVATELCGDLPEASLSAHSWHT